MERQVFDRRLNELLSEAECLIPKTMSADRQISNHEVDAREWQRFELDLWDIGETIRRLILESRKKPSREQLGRICGICVNSFAGRGRQSFVLLLGKKCYAEYAPLIAPFLSDSDIAGQTADTLYKMGTPDYISQMEPLTRHKQTWIRNIAKKYVDKYNASKTKPV